MTKLFFQLTTSLIFICVPNNPSLTKKFVFTLADDDINTVTAILSIIINFYTLVMVNVIIDITYRGNFHRGDCNDQNQWSNCPKLEIENVIMTIKKEESV